MPSIVPIWCVSMNDELQMCFTNDDEYKNSLFADPPSSPYTNNAHTQAIVGLHLAYPISQILDI